MHLYSRPAGRLGSINLGDFEKPDLKRHAETRSIRAPYLDHLRRAVIGLERPIRAARNGAHRLRSPHARAQSDRPRHDRGRLAAGLGRGVLAPGLKTSKYSRPMRRPPKHHPGAARSARGGWCRRPCDHWEAASEPSDSMQPPSCLTKPSDHAF